MATATRANFAHRARAIRTKRGFPQKMWKTSFLYQNEQKKMTPEGVIFLLIFND